MWLPVAELIVCLAVFIQLSPPFSASFPLWLFVHVFLES